MQRPLDHLQGEKHLFFFVIELHTGPLVGGDSVGGDAVGEGAGFPDATHNPCDQVQPLVLLHALLQVCCLHSLSAAVVGEAVGESVVATGDFVGDKVGEGVGAFVGLDVGGLGAMVGDFVGAFVGAFVGLDVGGFGAMVGDLVGAPVAHDPKQISTCATAGLMARLMLFAFTTNDCPVPAQLA
jgi:hypothetical protein